MCQGAAVPVVYSDYSCSSGSNSAVSTKDCMCYSIDSEINRCLRLRMVNITYDAALRSSKNNYLYRMLNVQCEQQ
jgi:hypothetical protein